ncbi:MAG TPA: Plug domain-containing protein [Gemmatimonadaceae bacterium]|nr:Plug domain-containing protein [Gemmatimonadaceae bacterium]
MKGCSLNRPMMAAVVVLATTACATSNGTRSSSSVTSEGRHFTMEAIRETGARTAWDALRRLPSALRLDEDSYGTPAGMSQRGQGNLRSTRSTLVVVDGFRITDIGILRDIRADEIHSMRVLSTTHATTRYGRDGWNGAIVIETIPAVMFRRR